MDIKERVKQEEAEIIKNMKTLCQYNSINVPGENGTPFGAENAKALAKALEILDGYGFKTKNLDNYAGFGEVGQGDKVIGMVGHLDIVPVVEKGWHYNPFDVTEEDGKLYGRGTSDDKGPVCCAIGALRIVKELRPDMNKRIRIVMGCNEETGSQCLRYYVSKEGDFDLGFTPDGEFPCIYGEKGMVAGHIVAKTNKIKSIKGGEASNIVCGQVDIELEDNCFDEGLFANYCDSNNIKYTLEHHGDIAKLTVYGVKAHASIPDDGINAINHAFTALDEARCKDPAVSFIARYFGNTCHGEKLGIDQHDNYGDLTLNLGVIKMVNDEIHCTIDIRFPVTKDLKQMEKEFKNATKDDEEGTLVVDGLVEPLFINPESALVKSLVKAYQKVTGDKDNMPQVIGGGTYAKAIKNTIAFGAEFPNDPDIHMHGDDEFMPKENICKQTEIYVEALLNLLDTDE